MGVNGKELAMLTFVLATFIVASIAFAIACDALIGEYQGDSDDN